MFVNNSVGLKRTHSLFAKIRDVVPGVVVWSLCVYIFSWLGGLMLGDISCIYKLLLNPRVNEKNVDDDDVLLADYRL